MSDIKVGSTIWRFDENRRHYPDAKPGDKYFRGGPIYREHWKPVTIVSETSRSWVTNNYDEKAPKKGEHHGWAFSAQEVDDDCFLHEHGYKISEEVRRLRDAGTLRLVADAIGYGST